MQVCRYLKNFLIIISILILSSILFNKNVYALDLNLYEEFYNTYDGQTFIIQDASKFRDAVLFFDVPLTSNRPTRISWEVNNNSNAVFMYYTDNTGSGSSVHATSKDKYFNITGDLKRFRISISPDATGVYKFYFDKPLPLKPLHQQEQWNTLGGVVSPPTTSPPTTSPPQDNSWIPTINGDKGFAGILDGIVDIILDFLKELLKHGKGIMIAGVTLGALFICGKWLFIKVKQWINKA